ncbi:MULTISPECIES: VacJ family lipoprotein [unclassified Pseudomonas]|jgi:phospholipid-binding lipoprotein MlaA|uniref:MlaA family lipoprotein n=1 Tax=unclassified Pseudomonas TaxID=196821 RepID=UPI000DAEEFAF|nr:MULTISPECIES: VacJ family lipoprotein [unclassified Pseudomonas]PZW46489.1 phospholipid-binding lipoprotein MlaA [Pseudomonas sp. URMO17WK12:I2]
MRLIGPDWIASLGRMLACAGLMALPLAGQAATEDPWESFNRPVFRFNDAVDTYALKPLAQGYRKVTPQFVETGVHNVFRNMWEVGNLANNLLQGKIHDAGVDTSRLLFNTTLGGLGFFDVATRMGLQRSDEDFGQTLGAWGVQSGPYLVLPLLGPSSLRDAPAKIPDSYLTPYPHIDHVPTRNVLRGVNVVDTRASLLDAERMVSGDKYIFIRNAYLQNREFRVRDGDVEDDF